MTSHIPVSRCREPIQNLVIDRVLKIACTDNSYNNKEVSLNTTKACFHNYTTSSGISKSEKVSFRTKR